MKKTVTTKYQHFLSDDYIYKGKGKTALLELLQAVDEATDVELIDPYGIEITSLVSITNGVYKAISIDPPSASCTNVLSGLFNDAKRRKAFPLSKLREMIGTDGIKAFAKEGYFWTVTHSDGTSFVVIPDSSLLATFCKKIHYCGCPRHGVDLIQNRGVADATLHGGNYIRDLAIAEHINRSSPAPFKLITRRPIEEGEGDIAKGMACFSADYYYEPQLATFTKILKLFTTRWKTKVSYFCWNHNLTRILFEFPEEPMISIGGNDAVQGCLLTMSDMGDSSVTLQPTASLKNSPFPLGNAVSIKHTCAMDYGKLVTRFNTEKVKNESRKYLAEDPDTLVKTSDFFIIQLDSINRSSNANGRRNQMPQKQVTRIKAEVIDRFGDQIMTKQNAILEFATFPKFMESTGSYSSAEIEKFIKEFSLLIA